MDYLSGQFGWSQQSPSKQRASILDESPGRAKCGLLDDVVDVSGRDFKFGRPVLIESKASRAVQAPQAPAPRSARERRAERLQGVVAKSLGLPASDCKGVSDAARRAPLRAA